jgi:hypothetical protein
MRESESFDAFYARTVASVTSRIHEIAGGDPQADHAIREAYARAYQQWYEVSGFRDTEGWVQDTARDAFERRRAEAAHEPSGDSGPPSGQLRDSGSWPGWFRPREPADLASTVAAPHAGSEPPSLPGALADGAQAEPGRPNGVLAAMLARGAARSPVREPAGPPARGLATELDGPGPVLPGRSSPGAGGYRPNWSGLRSRTRTLIIGCVVVAVVAAGIVYFALGNSTGPGAGHHGAGPGPRPDHKHAAKPVAHMLKAGQSGTRSQIPWTLVGQGWTLAEVSTTQAGTAQNSGGGATYLVDPVGGRYLVHAWSAGIGPVLLAWSGNGLSAVFATVPGAHIAYVVLSVRTGQVTSLQIPANVAVVGFTRPKGLALLAVKQGSARDQLVRYDLQGTLEAKLATISHGQGVPWYGCGLSCGALSSPDGTQAVWGAAGNQMQLVSNLGGIIRRLHGPAGGHSSQCVPISWWDASTVLASCSTGGAQSVATQLWLVPKDGSQGQALTAAAGSASGIGVDTDGWRASGHDYVTQTTGSQCPDAPSGPGGLEILRLSSSGAPATVAVPGSTGNHNAIIATDGSRLLVIAQMSCPGSSALMWLDPSTGSTQVLLPAPAGDAGVVAAVPWGSGTAAAGN